MRQASTYHRLRVGFVGAGAVGAVLYFLSTVVPGVRAAPGFDTTYDGWLQGGVECLLAVCAVLPVLLRRRFRAFWGMVAAAVVLRVIGFVLFLAWVRTLTPQPYPSVSDAFWLLSSLCLLGAVVIALRTLAPVMSRLMFLDGLMGALTAAAYGFALLTPTLQRLADSDARARTVLTNLTYPVLDVALIALVAGLLVSVRGDTSWASRMVLLGFLVFAGVDCLYLYLVTNDSWRPGSWVSGISMLALLLVAVAPWFAAPTREVDARVARFPHSPLETPIVLALLCTVLFVLDAWKEQSRLTMLSAAAAMLVAIFRGARTMTSDRRESRREIRASEDERVKFQALVETSGDFIAIAGMDGRVSYLNPAGRRMIGMSPTRDVRRTTIIDYLTEDGVQASLEVEQPAVVAHGHWEGESTLKHQETGEPIPVAISSFLMNHPDTGEPLALATVQRDITERLAQSRAVEALAEQRAVLLERLVRAEEAERARIAADVHDDSVQALAVVDLRLGMLRNQLGDASPEQLETLDVLRDSVARATSRLRQLLFDLEAPTAEVDLPTALTDAAAHLFHDTRTSWQVSGDGGPQLPEASRLTAYRIAREAMVNTLKHAQASRVDVQVATDDGTGGLLLSVADDGRGFGDDERRARPGHLGLSGMDDRAAIAGGWLEVDSALGQGTTVRLWLPLPDAEG
jgi:PAS domain S-box-containing protein